MKVKGIGVTGYLRKIRYVESIAKKSTNNTENIIESINKIKRTYEKYNYILTNRI